MEVAPLGMTLPSDCGVAALVHVLMVVSMSLFAALAGNAIAASANAIKRPRTLLMCVIAHPSQDCRQTKRAALRFGAFLRARISRRQEPLLQCQPIASPANPRLLLCYRGDQEMQLPPQ